MPSTAAANVGAAPTATSSTRRVTDKEDEADEEHNEDETIQVGFFDFLNSKTERQIS